MSWVSPIKDKETLQKFENGLKAAGEKYYVLFEIGLGTGLKMPDILDFRNRDVRKRKLIELNIGRKISAGSLRSRRNCKRSFGIYRGKDHKPGCFPGVPVPKHLSKERVTGDEKGRRGYGPSSVRQHHAKLLPGIIIRQQMILLSSESSESCVSVDHYTILMKVR